MVDSLADGRQFWLLDNFTARNWASRSTSRRPQNGSCGRSARLSIGTQSPSPSESTATRTHISATLAIWAAKHCIALDHIRLGKPQQNAFVARYNRIVRHEGLDLYIFDAIAEAQSIATYWLWTYNTERPDMGIGGITLAQKLNMAARSLGQTPLKWRGLPIGRLIYLFV